MATAPDPLRIFRPGGPIPMSTLHYMLHIILPALPGFHGARPDQVAALRHAVIHLIAAHEPTDAIEAMLAGMMVVLHAQAMECLRAADLACTDLRTAPRLRAQAASLLRCHSNMLRDLEDRRGRRRRGPPERTASPHRRATGSAVSQSGWPHSAACGQDPGPDDIASAMPGRQLRRLRLAQDPMHQDRAEAGADEADGGEPRIPGPEVTRH